MAQLNEWLTRCAAENIDLTLNQSERYEERPGGHIVTAPLEHGFIAPTLSLAVLTERDLTGRRRTHRISRPKKERPTTF